MFKVIVAVLVVTLIGHEANGEEDPLADTPLGKLKGYWMTSRSGRRFQAYSGVPYAQPPVGNLRFQSPRAALPWTEVKSAKEDGPLCLQMNIYQLRPKVAGVEDCLYLSVYTHSVRGKAPVIVHFHGGGYVSGNGARNTKPEWFMDEDVVIVNVNYRVGIMGFLSFEDEHMPGNQGMKDQVMSLRWVKENIASFGGDPGCVTIVGESAGSQSVYHHTVSPLSRGLFHRGISESGTSYNLGALMAPGYVRELSYKLAKLTNCKNDDVRTSVPQIVECLQKLDGAEVASQLVKFREWQIDPVSTFRVVFEKGPGAFLTCPQSGWTHARVPLLLGTTSGEGLLRTSYFVYYNMSWEWYNDNFIKIAPISLGYFHSLSPPKQEKTTKQIRSFYLPMKNIIDNGWENVVEMYTDSWFTIGIIKGADEHSRTADTYFYYFDYLGEKSLAGNLNTSLITGAFHTDEIIYLWNLRNYSNLRGQDLAMSKKMIKIWTNFAKYGNPTPPGSDINWDTWKINKNRFLHISNTGFKMEEDLAPKRVQFWNNLEYRDRMNLCIN